METITKTDNELIAEFMGYAFQKDKTTYPSGWYICDAYAITERFRMIVSTKPSVSL